MLPPLTFQEYIYLKNMDHLVAEGEIEYGRRKVPYTLIHDIKALNHEFIV